jgi:hypothetical protein
MDYNVLPLETQPGKRFFTDDQEYEIVAVDPVEMRAKCNIITSD